MANPTLAVDPGSTLLTIGKAVGGMALLGPFGLAEALASGKLGDKDPCGAALEAFHAMTAPPPQARPVMKGSPSNKQDTGKTRVSSVIAVFAISYPRLHSPAMRHKK